MAHFAQLDENNVVTQVIVVSNDDCSDQNGVESEELGIAFCKRLFGTDTNWKQTSYNNNMRVRYAGIGFLYNEQLDAFIYPKPFESWTLDEETVEWVSPLGAPPAVPEGSHPLTFYRWDEEAYQADNSTGWVLQEFTPPAEETPAE